MESSSTLRSRPKAFTLIELMIVIVIIGILAVALLPRVIGAPAKARDVVRKTDANDLINALELYAADSGYYPGTLGTVNCLGGSDAAAIVIDNYLQELPVDPTSLNSSSSCTSGGYYTYRPLVPSGSTGAITNYLLAVNLEGDVTAPADDVYCATALTVTGTTFQSYADAFSTLNGSTYTCSSTNSNGYFVVLK